MLLVCQPCVQCNYGSCTFVALHCSWGPTNAVANLYGSGTTTFTGCQFVQWDDVYNNGTAAIYADTGNLILQ